MYKFTLGDLEVECETADELRAAAGLNGNGTVSKLHPAYAKRTTRRTKKSDVPFLDRKITWDDARQVAQQLGRDDVRQVRSDLVARRAAGE